jgi:hypothetical protein
MTDEATVKEHEENVAAAEKALAEAKAKAAFMEFPKYIEPHESHVVTQEAAHGDAPPHRSTPAFGGFHVDREGKVKVLVHNAEEEAKALAAAVAAEVE